MKRHKVIVLAVVAVVCLLLSGWPARLLSQTQEPQSPEEAQRQQIRQRLQETQQHAEEQREQAIRQQEEFWQRIEERERQRLQESSQGLSPEEKQRREEAQQRKEEQRRQMFQRRRESLERDKQLRLRMEEQRRQGEEHQKAIRKAADEYSDEVWQEALGATPEQWKALKPRLERIHQLKNMPCVDVSIYWIAGSAGYQMQSLVGSPDGAHSVAKASGWFSITTGAGSTSESSYGHGQSAEFGVVPSDRYSATTKTVSGPEDSNRPDVRMEARHVGSEPARAAAGGAIQFAMQVPGPSKKRIDDIALGWQWERLSLDRSPAALSEGEKACERLAETFEMKDPDPEQVRQQVEALRQVRQQRRAELEEARRQLLALVTPAQEAKLIAMGYLE
jgi:hypothetical protein